MTYLQHHGIDGQKWGERNGPPYPLKFSAHSAAEKRKNPKKLIDNQAKKEKKPSVYSQVKNLSNEDLKIGINRMKDEKQYVELASRDITQGRAYTDSLMVNFGTTAVNSFVKTFGASLGAKAGTKMSELIFGTLSKSEKKAAKDVIDAVTDDVEKASDEIGKSIKEVREASKESTSDKKVYSGEVVDSSTEKKKKQKSTSTSVIPVRVTYERTK